MWKSVSGCMKHHLYARIGHHRVRTLTPMRIFGTFWRKLYTVVQLSRHHYKILVENVLQWCHSKYMPSSVLKTDPWNIIVQQLFGWAVCIFIKKTRTKRSAVSLGSCPVVEIMSRLTVWKSSMKPCCKLYGSLPFNKAKDKIMQTIAGVKLVSDNTNGLSKVLSSYNTIKEKLIWDHLLWWLLEMSTGMPWNYGLSFLFF